jgi:hypothetical protein
LERDAKKRRCIIKKFLLVTWLVCLCAQAQAAEVAGVTLADSIHLGNHDLVLNGAGLRIKFFFRIYVVALYLGEKTHEAEVALNQSGEKRIALHALHELTDEQMLDSFHAAMTANLSQTDMQAMEPQLKELTAIFHAIKTVKEGDVIALDYLPNSGTQIVVNGVLKGNIPGVVFNRALLKIWLGDHPGQPDLKQHMLGLE